MGFVFDVFHTFIPNATFVRKSFPPFCGKVLKELPSLLWSKPGEFQTSCFSAGLFLGASPLGPSRKGVQRLGEYLDQKRVNILRESSSLQVCLTSMLTVFLLCCSHDTQLLHTCPKALPAKRSLGRASSGEGMAVSASVILLTV